MNVTRYARRIQPLVATALQIGDDEERRQALETIAENAFATAYDDRVRNDSNDDLSPDDVASFTAGLGALDFTTGDSSPERVSDWIARSADNFAAVKAAPEGSVLEWRTQRDDRVRDIHAAADGQQRTPGEAFDIAGVPMLYPGQPTGTPDHWANCRCRLMVDRPAFVASADDEWDRWMLTAAVSEEPWSKYSASDYSIEQWRRACLIRMPDGDPESKSTYKVPILTPSGALNRAGVHAAAGALSGARGGVDAPADAKAKAKARLRGAYRQLKEEAPDSLTAKAGVPVPANTHDAPGWLTNPEDTERLRRYWTRGPGAAKIRWGTPGDLTRCHKHLEKYVGPFAWGTCNNMHHVVFGWFNPESRGRRGSAAEIELDDAIVAAFAAADSLEKIMDTPTMLAPPMQWFDDPQLDAPTALTISREGRVVGHLASWDTCHVGISGECVTPPHSNTNYAHYRTGEVETREGALVAVGQITMDTGHAGKDDGPQATVAHYDNTGTGVADVVVGEDAHGIWVAGAMRPGVSEQQMYVLKATGALSGDWRRIGGNLELVAALAVNVPGFPIPRLAMAASATGPLSLVAAAIVTADPNATWQPEVIAVAVVDEQERRQREALAASARREHASAIATRVRQETARRIAARTRVTEDV